MQGFLLIDYVILEEGKVDEEPEVLRAKYFIRDQFLVNKTYSNSLNF